MTFHKVAWVDLDFAQTFKAASDHALFWKQIQIGWKYSHVTQKVSEGTNVPNVLTGRGLQRTKKNLGLGYVLDDTKLAWSVSVYYLSIMLYYLLNLPWQRVWDYGSKHGGIQSWDWTSERTCLLKECCRGWFSPGDTTRLLFSKLCSAEQRPQEIRGPN